MFAKLLTFVKTLLHSESAFYIKKVDSLHYFLCAKNGLKAEIKITDSIMFVKAWSTIDYVAFYYCTPIKPVNQPIDHFVVNNIKQSIVYSLPAEQLSVFVKAHSNFFERFSTSEHPVIYLRNRLLRNRITRNLDLSGDDYNTHDYIKLDGVRYPVIYFKKKKVIKNVIKYQLKSVKKNDKTIVQKTLYVVGDRFIYLDTVSNFYSSKINYISDDPRPSYSMRYPIASYHNYKPKEKIIGIENQLLQHYEIGLKYLNLENILMLRTDDKEYCLLEKNNRQFTLSYIPSTLMHNENMQKLITISYEKGKVKESVKLIIPDMLKHHEMAISNKVMDNFQMLKLTKPSKSIVDSLKSLNVSTKLPLNPDDLTVLEMFEI